MCKTARARVCTRERATGKVLIGFQKRKLMREHVIYLLTKHPILDPCIHIRAHRRTHISTSSSSSQSIQSLTPVSFVSSFFHFFFSYCTVVFSFFQFCKVICSFFSVFPHFLSIFSTSASSSRSTQSLTLRAHACVRACGRAYARVQRGCVGVWVCGCVGVWVCGCVGVWVCG